MPSQHLWLSPFIIPPSFPLLKRGIKRDLKSPQSGKEAFKRGGAPLSILPPPLSREGDKGGGLIISRG